jgi:hypothetical protein
MQIEKESVSLHSAKSVLKYAKLRTPRTDSGLNSMRVISLGYRAFLRWKNVIPKPVCVKTTAKDPYSIRDETQS